jgi:DNA polymerase V
MKVFFLVDCNSFFASCERLFRPDLKNKPVGVLSSNDGCFVARSNELKEIGIKMGEPYFKVKQLCDRHQVNLFSSNFSLYGNLSDRVMKTLKTFSQDNEVYSIDEAFLGFSFFNHQDPAIDQLAFTIKETVERHTGIPVSIGVATTKTLAKLANNDAKKNVDQQGVCNILDEDKKIEVLKRTQVGDIWGIGNASAQKMHGLGLYSAYDFYSYPKANTIQKIFSIVGLKRYEELRGISHFKIGDSPLKKKGIMRSRSFSNPIFDLATLKQIIAGHITRAAQKLRAQESVCKTVEVFIRTSPFKNGPQRQVSAPIILEAPSHDTRTLIKAANKALNAIFKEGYEYKKAGIYLSDIQDQQLAQLGLFTPQDPRSDQLMKLVDHINRKQGASTISFATCKPKEAAYSHKQYTSPHYLTKWSEIAKVC